MIFQYSRKFNCLSNHQTHTFRNYISYVNRWRKRKLRYQNSYQKLSSCLSYNYFRRINTNPYCHVENATRLLTKHEFKEENFNVQKFDAACRYAGTFYYTIDLSISLWEWNVTHRQYSTKKQLEYLSLSIR